MDVDDRDDVEIHWLKPEGVVSDACEVITFKTTSLHSGIVEGDKKFKNTFLILEEDKKEVENNENSLDDG